VKLHWRALDASERALGFLMALVLFGMLLIGLVDVIGRYLFIRPLPGAAEIGEWALGILVFGSLPLVTRRRAHITVDLFTGLMRGLLDRVARTFVCLASAAIVAVFAAQLYDQAAMFLSYGDRSVFLKIPLAPLAFYMSAMAAITALILLWQALEAWRAGDAAGA
jgi:TRAP-type C4-dicarboxylate transport system permease small subunit